MAGPFNINPNKKRTITISQFLSAEDEVALVDGPPAHELDNDGATLVVSADGMSATVSNVTLAEDAPPRSVRLTIKADANRDPAVQDYISDFVDFVIIAPAGPVAAKMSLTVGEEESV